MSVDANAAPEAASHGSVESPSAKSHSAAVPLEPLANSFLPDAKGQYRGLLLADSQIKGAGITGTNLAKNLSGQVGFSFTNANLQLLGPKAKLLIWPIATFLGISDISQSPLNWMAAQVQ